MGSQCRHVAKLLVTQPASSIGVELPWKVRCLNVYSQNIDGWIAHRALSQSRLHFPPFSSWGHLGSRRCMLCRVARKLSPPLSSWQGLLLWGYWWHLWTDVCHYLTYLIRGGGRWGSWDLQSLVFISCHHRLPNTTGGALVSGSQASSTTVVVTGLMSVTMPLQMAVVHVYYV